MKTNVARLNCVLGHRIERVALGVTLACGRRAWCLFPDPVSALTFRDTDPLLDHDKGEWGYVVLSEEELAGFFRQQSGDLVACEPCPGVTSVNCIEAMALVEILNRRESEGELQSYARADLPNSRRSDTR